MPVERERVYLVSGDAAWRERPGSAIEQGYLAITERSEVRVRRRDGRATLTIKDRRPGVERSEVELPLPADRADELMAQCDGRRIRKTRREIEHAGLIWEVDVFHDHLEGLVLAEVELPPTVEPELPDWVGREVTDDQRFRNAQLVDAPGPPPIEA